MAKEPSRNRVLTADEYAALLKHCPDWLRRAVAFSWETSLSRSDLFHLTWNEIDLDGINHRSSKTAEQKPGSLRRFRFTRHELKALISELQQNGAKLPTSAIWY